MQLNDQQTQPLRPERGVRAASAFERNAVLVLDFDATDLCVVKRRERRAPDAQQLHRSG